MGEKIFRQQRGSNGAGRRPCALQEGWGRFIGISGGAKGGLMAAWCIAE